MTHHAQAYAQQRKTAPRRITAHGETIARIRSTAPLTGRALIVYAYERRDGACRMITPAASARRAFENGQPAEVQR